MDDIFKDLNKNEKEQEQKMISDIKNNENEPPELVLKEKIKNIPKKMVINKTNDTIFRPSIKPLYLFNNIKKENENISIKPIQTGLSQLNNHFIIPVIRCFNNVNRLINELTNMKMYLHLSKNNNKKLSFALVELLRNINSKKNKLSNNLFLPLKTIIYEMNPSIKEPKDLILFILEVLDEELNIKNNNFDFLSTDLYDAQCSKDLNDFRNTYFKNKLSIIFYEFFGFTKRSFCPFCQNCFTEEQIIKMLTFPIKEINKNKNKNNTISISDCFEYALKKNIDSTFYCNVCQKSCPNNQGKILYAPQTLIINLDWGNQFEYEINFEIEEYLDLKKYIENEKSINFYELIGVISYFKPKDNEGYYIAYCKVKQKWDFKWYKYDDEKENECGFDAIKNVKYPTILFYTFILR
jgi:hypothetical protein